MELEKILEKIEINLKDKDLITEELYKINIELSKEKTHLRKVQGIRTEELKRNTPYNLIKDIVNGKITDEIEKVDLLEVKKMYLFNKLENIRQELMILSSLLKNESELIK